MFLYKLNFYINNYLTYIIINIKIIYIVVMCINYYIDCKGCLILREFNICCLIDMFSYIINKIEKNLRLGFVNSSGRNFRGVICVHHKGGGNKSYNLYIDFFRRINLFGYVCKIKTTSKLTGLLGLIIYQNGISSYLLLSEKLNVGDRIYCGTTIPLNKEKECLMIGSSISMKNVAMFAIISNIERKNFKGGQLMRAAGTGAIVTSKIGDLVSLKLKSGWNLPIRNNNICSLGIVSNSQHRFLKLKKAGKKRALGVRPTVRGVAMNPCDHPHGGGEGKKSPSVAARSPWGWLTKGTPSNKKKYQIAYKKLFKTIR